MIRQFYLENEYGDVYYFNHKNRTLISQVSGLGFSLDLKYLEYSRFYSRSEYNIPLSEITETLIFLDGYKGYKSFVDYISLSSTKMKLHYENDAFKAYCYVDIASLSKAELVATTIQSNVVFKKLSLWLKEKTYEIIANGSSSGKVYPYMYPYHYTSSYEGKVSVKNDGLHQAPLVIEISGSVIDPEVLIKKNGSVQSVMRFFLTAEDITLKVNAIPGEQEMIIDQNGIVTEIYAHQDFEEDNFLFLDHGNYEIEFRPGVATPVSCKITIVEGFLGI
jgi:hypothetical protein